MPKRSLNWACAPQRPCTAPMRQWIKQTGPHLRANTCSSGLTEISPAGTMRIVRHKRSCWQELSAAPSFNLQKKSQKGGTLLMRASKVLMSLVFLRLVTACLSCAKPMRAWLQTSWMVWTTPQRMAWPWRSRASLVRTGGIAHHGVSGWFGMACVGTLISRSTCIT